MENNIESLWEELTEINDLSELRMRILQDIKSNENRYKILAVREPLRLFELLGGDIYSLETKNWAHVYSYEEYLIDNDEEFDAEVAEKWDIVTESTEHAYSIAKWYVTGHCNLGLGHGMDLLFVIGFSEDEIEEVINTPYKTGDFPNENWVEMF